MTIYFTSDLHFSHANVLKYDNRPFATVEEMNEAIVTNWNTTVTNEDTVYFLGDLSLNDNVARQYMPRLKGKIIWICGNHDPVFPHKKKKKADKRDEHVKFFLSNSGVVSISVGPVNIEHEGVKIKMSHFPYHSEHSDPRYAEHYPREGREDFLLHGHCHIAWKRKENMINVGCMHWDYKPVSIDTLIAFAKEWELVK